MRKIYLAASVLLVGGIAGAQMQSVTAVSKIAPYNGEIVKENNQSQDRAPGDDVVTDNFSVPANWTTPADVNGHAWTIGNTTPAQIVTYMGGMASTTASNGHASFNGIQYILAGAVNTQDVLLNYVPTINCTGLPSLTLEFEQRYRAFNSDQVIVEVSGNNGVAWTTWEINTGMATNAPAIQETYTINISAVAGNQSQVKVRFRWFEDSGDDAYGSGYGWCIDDFRIFESYNYDQQNTASFARSGIVYAPAGLDYYMVPTSQITPITFSGITTNFGGAVQTGAQFNVTVDKSGNVYTGSSAAFNLAVGTSDSVSCATTFTPAAGTGLYDYTMWFDGTNAEEVTDNDTLYSWLEITDDVYSRDDNSGTGAISAVSSSPEGVLQIGNVMEIFAPGTITELHVGITNTATNEAQLMYAQIYLYDGTDYIYQESTADFTIGAGDLNSVVVLPLLNEFDVFTGDDILIVAGHYGGPDPVEFYTCQGTDEGTVLGFVDGTAFYLSSPQAVLVRATIITDAGVEDENFAFTVGQNVPNPFNGNSVITYSLTESSNVSVEFVDATGKVVKTVASGTQVAGTYTIAIDGVELAEGVYFYTFTIGDKKVTKRMVVTK